MNWYAVFIMMLFALAVDDVKADTPVPSSTHNSQPSLLLRDYQFVKNDDPWLTSRNAAALTRFATENIAEAELSLTCGRGGFVDYSESPHALQADAAIESFFRLSPRTVVYGSMSYNYFDGKDMTGSVFTFPSHPSTIQSQFSHLPFDIVEDSLGNEGDKHRDTYRLCGGFGSDVLDGLSVGMRLTYTAANYAKYKDLRHQNKLMDLQLLASVYWPFASWGSLGADYLYHRNTETINFGVYGKSDKTYMSLIDYAGFMGHVEQYGNTGYADKSREMPLVSETNGVGLQLSIQHSAFSFFNTFDYAHRHGYYGRKSPYTITYANHRSNIYDYAARLSFQPSPSSRHHLAFSLSVENLQNDASTYRELQNDAGATYYEYYTPVKTANKLWTSWSVAYTSCLGLQEELPTWTFQVGVNNMQRQQTAYTYPYYRRQKLTNHEIFVDMGRNIVGRQGVWSLTVGGSFLKGKGEPFEDLTFLAPSDKQSATPAMEAFLYREYQYLTAPQYSIGGTVKYAFVFPGTKMQTYAKTTLTHRKANVTNDYSRGCDHLTATFTLGCTF